MTFSLLAGRRAAVSLLGAESCSEHHARIGARQTREIGLLMAVGRPGPATFWTVPG